MEQKSKEIFIAAYIQFYLYHSTERHDESVLKFLQKVIKSFYKTIYFLFQQIWNVR